MCCNQPGWGIGLAILYATVTVGWSLLYHGLTLEQGRWKCGSEKCRSGKGGSDNAWKAVKRETYTIPVVLATANRLWTMLMNSDLAYIHVQVCKDSRFEQLCSSRVHAQGSHYSRLLWLSSLPHAHHNGAASILTGTVYNLKLMLDTIK